MELCPLQPNQEVRALGSALRSNSLDSRSWRPGSYVLTLPGPDWASSVGKRGLQSGTGGDLELRDSRLPRRLFLTRGSGVVMCSKQPHRERSLASIAHLKDGDSRV